MSKEKREYARINLPFEVEISHVSIGNIRTTATNIAAGGIFVELDEPALKPGASIRLTVLSLPLVESPPTPSIRMIVSHASPQGLGLAFASNTSRHLWESVKRARNSLVIGEDYFQIYQNALVINSKRQILLVQQTGKWLLPGGYLKVGQDWKAALQNTLKQSLGLSKLSHLQIVNADSHPNITSKETAVFTVFHKFLSASSNVKCSATCQYSHFKWVGDIRDINERTFSHPLLRSLVIETLNRLEDEPLAPLTS